MRKVILMASLAFVFGACSNDKNESETEKTFQTAPIENGASDNALSDEVLVPYLEIKDALVASDVEKAKINAASVLNRDSRSDVEEQLMAPIERIANAGTIEEAREAFFEYSQLIADLVVEKGGSVKLYKQFCPMAFDNSGAFWISAEKEIRNPYFGDKMLRCGEVQAEY